MYKPIQIVNKSGLYIGTAEGPREALLANQIRLVSRVIITNGDGKYLLQKRADNMFVYPGFWDSSAAGHVDDGETADEAAYRELAEEIGIDNIKLNKVGQLYTEMQENHGYISRIFNHIFTGTFTADITKLKLDPTEVVDVQWFSRGDITAMIQHNHNVTEGIKLIFNEVL